MAVKDVDFFGMFIEGLEYSIKICKQLLEMVNDYTDIDNKTDEIHKTEHEADLHLHKLIEALNKTFIPPIEREDILSIAQGIDNVTDKVEDICNNFSMYNVASVKDEAKSMISLIEKSCYTLKEAACEFPNFKKSKVLIEKCVEVNNIEEQGDKIYKTSMRKLFKTETNPIELIKWRAMFDALENCLDSCEDVADLMESVVMKNS